jgi:hypothetical protein
VSVRGAADAAKTTDLMARTTSRRLGTGHEGRRSGLTDDVQTRNDTAHLKLVKG